MTGFNKIRYRGGDRNFDAGKRSAAADTHSIEVKMSIIFNVQALIL